MMSVLAVPSGRRRTDSIDSYIQGGSCSVSDSRHVGSSLAAFSTRHSSISGVDQVRLDAAHKNQPGNVVHRVELSRFPDPRRKRFGPLKSAWKKTPQFSRLLKIQGQSNGTLSVSGAIVHCSLTLSGVGMSSVGLIWQSS
jgi:hypothetical protein